MKEGKSTDIDLEGKAFTSNVALAMSAMEAAVNRPAHLPGIVALTGPAGFGKSQAASVVSTNFNAVSVQIKKLWTRKGVLLAILKEMNVVPAATLYGMGEQIAEELALSRRPLIVDECDFLVAKGDIEIIRDIYESSLAAIMIIGEETMPAKLKVWERFHSRVLRFCQAQPINREDARKICDVHVTGVEIADDLLFAAIKDKECKGSARRLVTALEAFKGYAVANGISRMDLAAWGDRPLMAGDVQIRKF